ncbi:hypothetical protein FOFC_20699, partial [Fusarium oxysporum]
SDLASLDPSLQAHSTAGSNAAAALKPFTDSSTSPHYWHRLRDSNLRPCNRCCYASLPSRSLCSQPRHKRPTSASAC